MNLIPAVVSTVDEAEARLWLAEGRTVLARTDERGMKGKGIVTMLEPCDLISAPLYTMYIQHQAEVRVHVMSGKVIEILDKTANGFASLALGGDYQLDEAMLSSIAVRTITALNLDFGAVDILWNEDSEFDGEEAVVLEVNTAPELKDGTLDAYVKAFKVNINFDQIIS